MSIIEKVSKTVKRLRYTVIIERAVIAGHTKKTKLCRS